MREFVSQPARDADSGRHRRTARDDRGRPAHEPHEISRRGWMDVARRVKDEVKADQLPAVAAGLAFYAMLSVFPALIAFVSIYGLVADPAQVERQISSFASSLPAGAATLIQNQLGNVVDTAPSALGWAAAAAILGALWSASGGAQQMIVAVNRAYGETESRGFLKLRGTAVLMTIAFTVFGIVALGLIIVVPPLVEGIGLGGGATLAISIGRFVLLAVFLAVMLSVVYRYAPDRDQPRWSWVSWGAVAAVVIWIGASILFSFYVSNFGSFGETYGSLAGVIVLMLWFYISGFTALLGAEINAEMEHQTAADTTAGDPEPVGRRGTVKADTLPDR